MLSQYERTCSASCALTISPKYRHIDLEKETQAHIRHTVVEITHNMSAYIYILREIDELSESMSGDKVTEGDKRTVEKLSVAL